MGTLAEEAAQWKPRGDRYAVSTPRPYRFPLGRWREFWTEKRGYVRFSWGEITNSFGLALGVSEFEEHWSLHVHLIWPNIYLRLRDSKDRDFDNRSSYSVSLWNEGSGPELYLQWGRKSKFLKGPWTQKFVRREWMDATGKWRREPRVKFWRGMPDALRDSAHELQQAARDLRKAEQWQTVETWEYRSRSCDLQSGTALIAMERMTWRQWWLQWCPLFQNQRTTIDVSFSREVGSEAGSWKGGTIGCGFEIKRGESPIECFRRMMQDRSFDR